MSEETKIFAQVVLVRSILPYFERSLPHSPCSRVISIQNDLLFFAALLWLADNDGAWDELPGPFGNRISVYQRFNRWCRSGRLQNMFDSLCLLPDFPYRCDGKVILSKNRTGGGLRLTRRVRRRTLKISRSSQQYRNMNGPALARFKSNGHFHQ